MRKQDRIAAEHKDHPTHEPGSKPQPEPRPQGDQVKGKSADDFPRPPRQSGRMPLPD
jgi:hypothetical protein